MTSRGTFDAWEKKLPRNRLVDRDEWMLRLCTGRSVIHFGACDSPMTKEKAQRGELLHQKVRRVAQHVVGFDNDLKSIELLRREFGIDDILHSDLAQEPGREERPADVVLCADIIEHVANVGGLLSRCERALSASGILVLSTINALSLKQALRALIGREPVHPEHIAYYSYSTLGRLLADYGFDIQECRWFAYPAASRPAGLIFDVVYAAAPQVADGIGVVASRSGHA